MRLCLVVLSLWLAVFSGPEAWAAPRLVIVSSERSAAYLEASRALIAELERGGTLSADVLVISPAELAATARLSPALFVVLGAEAAKVVLHAGVRAPVLCTLLPRSSFERLLSSAARKTPTPWSALYLDQPWSRQLELIRLAVPSMRRIAVLWGPESQQTAPALKAIVAAKGFELLEASVAGADSVFPDLQAVLHDAELLLAVPDPQLYNSNSIQHILLASFRARVPMVAFSPAYVRAGALLALYVTPTQIGLQAGAIARDVLQGKALPAAPLYSRDFKVAVNEHVARSLGLSLDADALRLSLRQQEGLP